MFAKKDVPGKILKVTIDNTRARTDVTGQLMDVHDGTIIRSSIWIIS